MLQCQYGTKQFCTLSVGMTMLESLLIGCSVFYVKNISLTKNGMFVKCATNHGTDELLLCSIHFIVNAGVPRLPVSNTS